MEKSLLSLLKEEDILVNKLEEYQQKVSNIPFDEDIIMNICDMKDELLKKRFEIKWFINNSGDMCGFDE